MDIELINGATPIYKRPYPVAHVHLETSRKEIKHLVEIGVLSQCGESAFGAPTFIIPKKDGRVRVVSDMRDLKKIIKHTNYTLPIITDTLRKHHGYKFFTKIDISMQYYTFELTENAKNMCVITTPFGNFRYERAPMGLLNSAAFAQACMEEVLCDIPEVDVYINDIGIFTDLWDCHIEVVDEVMRYLEERGFTVNSLKCEWAVQETNWLGYWVTPNGLRSSTKKDDAILKLKPPSNAYEIRPLVRMVNYYRDMWARCTHMLSPITALSHGPRKQKVEWATELDVAFK